MKKSKGFTLIEIVVVLAIIAVIAAILTPMLFDYLKESKVSRAKADVRSITGAIANFNRDTGVFPIYKSAIKSSEIAVNVLQTEGKDAEVKDGVTGWGVTLGTDLGPLSDPLYNGFLLDGSTRYSDTTLGSSNHWKGPYMTDFKSDPWGNRYYVACDGVIPDNVNAAFVISAGPNGVIETNRTQAIIAAADPVTTGSVVRAGTPIGVGAFTIGGDDIVYRIK